MRRQHQTKKKCAVIAAAIYNKFLGSTVSVPVMSNTFTLSSRSSVLSTDFYPPIQLDVNSQYGLGLIGFYSYNSIFNVDESNNRFGYYKTKDKRTLTIVHIPPGAYEINQIYRALLKLMNIDKDEDARKIFTLRANNNTLKCEIWSTYEIDFTIEKSIGTLLGMDATVLPPKKTYESTYPVEIMKVRMIHIDCNIVSGAYQNAYESHTLFEFDIDVEPGYKLTREPATIIYLPIKPEGRQFINNITVRVLDDNGHLINFRGEKIIVKLELKKLS